MSDWQFYVLPMVWAAIAVGVARFLYKTSEAHFEGDSLFGMPAKGLRMTGSVLIFVVVMFVLVRVTLEIAPERSARGHRSVDEDALALARSIAGEIDIAATDLESCRAMNLRMQECGVDPATLSRAARTLHETFPAPGPSPQTKQ